LKTEEQLPQDLQAGRSTNRPAFVERARGFLLQQFNEKQDSRLTFHSFEQTALVVEKIEALAKEEGISPEETEIAMLAAYLTPLGYLKEYRRAHQVGVHAAEEFLTSQAFPGTSIARVLQAMEVILGTKTAIQPAAQLLSDATTAIQLGHEPEVRRPLLRLEQELMLQSMVSDYEWNRKELQELMNSRYYLATGKKKFEGTRSQLILKQRKKVQKSKFDSGVVISEDGQTLGRKFQDLERKLPSDATQTFFRANYRNHINLSAIADNKANIMISVNAIVVSIVVSLLMYQDLASTKPMVVLPVVLFLITGLTSLILAVLSIRPKVTNLNDAPRPIEEVRKNIVFFGNFIQLPIEQYEEAMDAVFRDGELLYGNMVRDLYYLGKVLDKKYRYLTMSYNVFMVGFAITVGTVIVALFL